MECAGEVCDLGLGPIVQPAGDLVKPTRVGGVEVFAASLREMQRIALTNGSRIGIHPASLDAPAHLARDGRTIDAEDFGDLRGLTAVVAADEGEEGMLRDRRVVIGMPIPVISCRVRCTSSS